MKKIGILFPYLRDSGICKVAAVHSIMFTEAGYEVDLIVRDNKVVYLYDGNLVNLNIKTRKGLSKIITYIELFLKFKKLKKTSSYDIIISHTPHCDIINVLSKNNEIIITTVHSNITKKYSKLAKFLLKFIINRSDKLVTVSQGILENMRDEFSFLNHKIKCIHNPLNLDEIDKKSNELMAKDFPKQYIITAGRLSIEKGQWHLIKAFSLFSKEFPSIKLVIIGEGTLRKKLEELVKKLNMSQNIIFEGFQNNPYKYMKSADLFVLPSLHEGYGLVLLESIACQTPVLATDCGGPREIIAPDKSIGEVLDYTETFGYGWLLPDFGNIKDLDTIELSKGEYLLSDKLKDIFKNMEFLKEYKSKKQNIVYSFSKEEILKEWQETFKNIVKFKKEDR